MHKQRKSTRKDDRMRKMTDLLAVLSKPGALRIFILAEDGIRASTSTHLKMGLSRKQYYTRLLQLVSTGLLEKSGGTYFQTAFGKMVCHVYIPRLEASMMNLTEEECDSKTPPKFKDIGRITPKTGDWD